MKLTDNLKAASMILISGLVPYSWAQATSPSKPSGPPKLVTATPRPAEPSKTPSGRVVNRRPPPKDLLAQMWPGFREDHLVPATVSTADAELRAKFERAQSLMAERKPELALPILLDAVKAAGVEIAYPPKLMRECVSIVI